MENETLARVNADETARSNYVESGSSGLRTVFGVVLLGISLLLFLTLALGALSDFGHLLARLGGEGRPALYFDLISSSVTMLPWAIPFILASAAWRTLCSTRGLGDFARISLISALVGFFLIVLLYSFLAFLHSGSLRDIEYPPFFAGYAIIFILIAIIWEFPGSTRVSDEIMRAIFALDFFSGLFYLVYWKFVVCL